jgi:chaperonin GroES
MIEKLKSKNNYVLLDRHIPEEERGGLAIPDVAKKKPQTGTILSVGKLVADKTIKEGQVAYFHKTAGWEMEIGREVVFVLRDQDVIACVDKQMK